MELLVNILIIIIYIYCYILFMSVLYYLYKEHKEIRNCIEELKNKGE